MQTIHYVYAHEIARIKNCERGYSSDPAANFIEMEREAPPRLLRSREPGCQVQRASTIDKFELFRLVDSGSYAVPKDNVRWW